MDTPARTFGYLFGAVYLLVGLVGFVVTGFDNFASPDGDLLIAFEVNPLHNIVHILIGAALVAGAAAGEAAARSTVALVAIVYAAVGIVGFFIPQDSEINILALNTADHFLHLGTAVLGFIAVAASRNRVGTARA